MNVWQAAVTPYGQDVAGTSSVVVVLTELRIAGGDPARPATRMTRAINPPSIPLQYGRNCLPNPIED